MDIVIAAAGRGTRLGKYTESMPKHIIEIAGRPFLYYLLDAAVQAQFRRIIVVGGYEYKKLEAAVNAYESDAEVIAVNQEEVVEEGKYGTACPLFAVENVVQGDRFVYTMGDHLVSAEDLSAMQQSTHEMLIASYEHNEPERFGVLETDGTGHLVKIHEKPTNPIGNLVNVGLYTFTKEVFKVVHHLESSQRGEYEITDAINVLANRTMVSTVPLRGHWLDLGRPEDIASLEQFMNSGTV